VTRWRTAEAPVWFALLGPPAAWAAQLLFAWAVEETACPDPGLDPTSAVIAFSVAAAAVALAGLVVAVLRAVRIGHDADPLGRATFLAWGGVLVAAVFLGAIVLAGTSAVVLDSCDAG
jgi:hypothetical protein